MGRQGQLLQRWVFEVLLPILAWDVKGRHCLTAESERQTLSINWFHHAYMYLGLHLLPRQVSQPLNKGVDLIF